MVVVSWVVDRVVLGDPPGVFVLPHGGVATTVVLGEDENRWVVGTLIYYADSGSMFVWMGEDRSWVRVASVYAGSGGVAV